jgi:TonB family protein
MLNSALPARLWLMIGLAIVPTGLLAQAPPPPPPPPPPVVMVPAPAPSPAPVLVLRERPGSPVPKVDLGFVITMNDYPAKPRKRGEGGLTGFDLTVDRDGKPITCQVTKRSESRELDEATCRLALARMKFEPAIDASGVPATGIYSGQVKWDPARKPDAPLPGTVTHTFIVEPDGSVTNCRIAAVTGSAKKQHRVGPEPCRHQDVFVSPDPAAVGKRKLVTEVETIVVSEVPVAPATP